MPDRRHISKTTKLAAALLTIVRPDDTGQLVPVIPREEAKGLTAEQIVARFEFDHIELHALGGSDHPSNLFPRPTVEHREKSRKDTSAVAKVRRLSREQEEFRARLLCKGAAPDQAPPRRPKRRIPSRPFCTRKTKENPAP